MASLMETEDKVHVVSMMGDAGFGSDGANEDNREEEALREMWQQCEDPEEKRQLRTRMYKLREDRIRDFYVGRDGQEILESILRTDNVSSRGCGDDDNANLEANRSVTSVASMVVTSSEIQSGHELTPVTVTKSAATVMKQVSKQGFTTTTTTTSKKTMKTNSPSSESDTKEETKQVKNRGTAKDRSPSLQLKEIKEQKNQHKPLLSNRRTVRRKSSAGENEIMAGNISRTHPKQTSTVTYVLSNKVTNNQGKVVVGSNNIRNGVDATGDGTNKGRRDSRVSKQGNSTTTITARNNNDNNAISSSTNASSSVITKTTIGGSTRVSGDGRKVNNSMIETTTITNMRSTKSSTMTTIKNVSSSTTIGRIGFSSTAKKTDGVESFEKSSTGHKSRRKVMSSSLANESIPLGSVHIEELMETPAKDEVKVQRGTTRAKKSSEKNVKESTAKYQRKLSSNADGEPINRNLSSGGGGGQQVTKSEMTKAAANATTTTSSARTCSKGSATLNIHGSSSTTATGSSGDRSTGQDRGNKVVNKSRESSPKRSGSSYKGNSTRGTKATLKTGESLETPVIKVDREGEESSVGYGDGESMGSKSLKKDNNKTEESIIRELDILDCYLSQRSISIDEASAKESEKVDRTITTTTMELGGKPVGGGNLAGKLDVMEVGIEPPFTRTEYKYNCPGEEDHHRHHKDHHHGDSSADRNTNELREPQSARNRDHDTKLNSSIEDQIIVDVVETSLTPSTRVPSNKGKSRSSSKPATLKANLSTNSATSKTNIKASAAGIEPLMPAKKVDPTFLQPGARQSSSTQMQIKQQKNETEILNRPSRKEQPKLTGTKNTSTFISPEEKVKSKPEPNPRALKKSFDSNDDETVEGSVVKMNSKIIRRDNVDDNNEDDNDDPLRPQTMKQGHDHPGAVLKAKSLFETKAQEAAMDRASADFDMDKGITQSAKVSKKAALFEARSRGERISVSSESSVATSAPDEKGGTRVTQPVNQTELTTATITSSTILSNTDNEKANRLESPKKVSSTLMATSTSIAPTLKREKSILTAASKEIKDQDSSTATTVRSIKRKTSNETSTSKGSTTNTASAYTTRRRSSEVKFDMNENAAKTEQTRSSNKSGAKLYQQRCDSGKSETDEEQKMGRHPRRKSETGRESQKKELQSFVTTTSSTTGNRRRASQDKKVSPEPQPAAAQKRDDESKRNENRRPSFPSHSTRKNSLQEAANCTTTTTTSSALLSRSDKLEQDENKRGESSGNTITMTSTSVQINSNRMTTTELNAVMEIEDIEELTRLLEKATDYDERSKIRGRIRALKRKAALVKRPSAENETTEGETLSKRAASAFTTTAYNVSSTSESVSIMNAKNKAMSSTTATSTSTTNTTCGNGRKKSNERRRSSGEIPSNKVTTRKKSSELIGRKNSSDDNNKNAPDVNVVEVKKTLRTNVVKSANDERKVRSRNKSSSPSPPPQSQPKPHAVTPQTIETTLIDSTVPTTTSSTMGGGEERRLSWETQQLLSTRKYSRESPRQGEDEKKVSKVIDDVTTTPPNIKSGLTKEKVEPTPEETLGPAPTLEEKPTKPSMEEKTPKPLIKKSSRDKTSPPRSVSSLIESVAASTTMQKSREMTKAEKYEADILSRPSVFYQRRQEQQESQNTATKQEHVTTTAASFKSKTLKTGETCLTSPQKSSSSWNQEIRVTKDGSPEPPSTKSSSRKNSADDSQDKVAKVTRKSSKDEIKEKSPPPPTRVPQRSSPTKYTRKGSSKEFKVAEKLSSNESAKQGEKIEMISKIPTTPAQTSSSPPASKKGGATTKDDQKSEDDKHKSDTEINFNQVQQSQSSSPPTTKHPKSEQQAPPPATTSSLADRNKKTVKTGSTDTPVKKHEKNSSAPLMDSSNSTSTTGSTVTKFNLSTKSSSSSSGTTTNDTTRDSSGTTHSKGTESVTSSYGVGPTDDDGTPLFGLKALRKIKQVQEQITTSTTSSAASTESTEKAGLSKEDGYTSTKQSLRASENFGLKALKKGSVASKGLLLVEDEDEEDTKKTQQQQQKKKNKIPESSVPEGSTRQTKSEFLSSTTASTIRLQSSSSPPHTTETETAEQRGANLDRGNSPKSILKKTSSFTSQIGTSGEGGGGGGVVKPKTAEDDDDGNNFDEIESGTTSINSVKVGEDETTDEFTRLTTTSTTSNITHSHNLGSDGGMEDSSWRRKSATPSPDPMNVSSSPTTNVTSSGLLSLSRGKVGRSSVKEMSKRFLQTSESGETLSNCQTQQNLNEGDVVDHKPVFIRGSSPSRIPSPVKPSTTTTTITTTTKSSVEVSGGDPDGNIKIEVNRGDPDHEEVSYYSPSDSDGGGSGIIRITRTVTTTSGIGGGGGGRSFLNDSSPIQNLSDVIERMRGEEGQRKYTEDFSEDVEEGDCEKGKDSAESGLNLLNKFIGAQIIMKSVEPMLLSKKVTMSSSSLIVNGVNVDMETDPVRLRQLLAEVEGEDRERIGNRLRSLESGGTSVERSASTPSTQRSRPLTKTLSIGGVTLGSDSSDVADVTEERFSFNRSQFSRAQIWAQSSSKSLDMSNLMSGLGGGGSGSHAQYYTPMQSPPFCNQNHPFYDQQMQTFCETSNRRQFNFQQQQNGVPPLPTMRPQLPPLLPTTTFPSVVPVVTTPPISGGIAGTSSIATNSQIQQNSQIIQQSSSSSTSSFKSTTTSSSVGGGAGLNKFKQMDQQAKANSGGAAPMFKLSQGLKTSANSAKDILLYWCQCRTRDYENVKIENFSSSWSDGLAFCALIHHFYPDAFDYKSLDPKNRRFNFDLAFRVADEKAGIYPLLDTEDMIVMGRRPDWKCVFTYVQSMYRSLKDLA